eukprot:gb/GECG01001072.1/.p1 GENE.gb/GECG01001072.1/~~gb/GECG01001072.1/.p1  ORF type:complete len:284 (+),score=18.59 gb/GECG01001072.1/:1-852(+)
MDSMTTNGKASFLDTNTRQALLDSKEIPMTAQAPMDQSSTSIPMGDYQEQKNSSEPPVTGRSPVYQEPRQQRRPPKYNTQAGSDENGGELSCSALCTCCGICGKMQGNTLRCWGGEKTRYFPFTCMIGPHWPLNLCVWGILLIPGAIYFVFVASDIDGTTGIAIFVVSALLIASALVALACTSFSDPGYLPRLTPEEAEQQRELLVESNELNKRALCRECNQFRTAETHHCYDCNRCCEELDHHCPWMGKDIGKYNLQFFYCFLWSFCISIIFAVITTFVVVL